MTTTPTGELRERFKDAVVEVPGLSATQLGLVLDAFDAAALTALAPAHAKLRERIEALVSVCEEHGVGGHVVSVFTLRATLAALSSPASAVDVEALVKMIRAQKLSTDHEVQHIRRHAQGWNSGLECAVDCVEHHYRLAASAGK